MNLEYQENKIILKKEGQEVAFLTYECIGKTLIITNTFVSLELRGQKIGERMMKEILKYASTHHYNVKATCSYAQHYLEKRQISV